MFKGYIKLIAFIAAVVIGGFLYVGFAESLSDSQRIFLALAWIVLFIVQNLKKEDK